MRSRAAGQIRQKLDEPQLMQLLDQINAQAEKAKPKIAFRRRGGLDDDDDDDDEPEDLGSDDSDDD